MSPSNRVATNAERIKEMPYITYLRHPEQHSNAAVSYPGWGETKEESRENSLYWPNQLPWVVTVAASRAPRWAQEDARNHEGDII